MRVLHVLDHSVPLHSGYSFRTLAILNGQRALGWETVHLTSTKHTVDGASDEEEVDGLHFFRTRAANRALDRVPVMDQLAVIRDLTARLLEVIERTRPDIVHAHSPALNGIAALRASRKTGVPVVYELRALWEDAAVDHGTTREGSARYRLSRALETFVLKRARQITTISEGLRADIIGRGVRSDLISVIPNGVDTDHFEANLHSNAGLRATLGLDDAWVLGFVGSFYGYEGLAILIGAMPEILEGCPNARLMLVGGGFEDKALRQQVHDLALQDVVVFTGRVPHDQVASYYAAMDVMVYPRLSMRLTELVTPLKPLEAMAQGRLVMASDVGGHREMIRHGDTGILFEAGDSGSLAKAALALLATPESWQEQRDSARRYVEDERSWSSVIERYRPVYSALVS